MAVRSQRFFVNRTPTVAATWQVAFTVPPGRTARGSLFTVSNVTGAPVAGGFGLGPVATAKPLWWGSFQASATHFAAGIILNPGDELLIYSATLNALWFGGYGSLLLGSPS